MKKIAKDLSKNGWNINDILDMPLDFFVEIVGDKKKELVPDRTEEETERILDSL